MPTNVLSQENLLSRFTSRINFESIGSRHPERGGKDGGSKQASAEFRRLRVKVAEHCPVHAALIHGGSKSVSSPDGAKKGEWKLERVCSGRVGFWQHPVPAVSRSCQFRQRQERQAHNDCRLAARVRTLIVFCDLGVLVIWQLQV